MKKLVICTSILTVAGFSLTQNAIAASFLSDIGNFLDEITLPIHQQLAQIENYSDQMIAEVNEALIETVGSEIATDSGEMGIPAIFAFMAEYTSHTDPDLFEKSPVYPGSTAKSVVVSETTESYVEGQLSIEGQDATKQRIDAAINNAQTSHEIAETAIAEISTQDVLKNMAQQQAIQSHLSSSIATSLEQMQTGQSLSNLNLAQINQSLNESNQQAKNERAGYALELHRITSFAKFN